MTHPYDPGPCVKRDSDPTGRYAQLIDGARLGTSHHSDNSVHLRLKPSVRSAHLCPQSADEVSLRGKSLRQKNRKVVGCSFKVNVLLPPPQQPGAHRMKRAPILFTMGLPIFMIDCADPPAMMATGGHYQVPPDFDASVELHPYTRYKPPRRLS